MKKIILGFIFLASIACENSSSNKNAPAAPSPLGVFTNSMDINKTNYSLCQGPTPTNYKIEDQLWHAKLVRSNDVKVDVWLAISNGYLLLSNDCIVNGTKTLAQGYSQVSIKNDQLKIWNEVQDQKPFTATNGSTMYCGFRIAPQTFNYTFKGPCLEISLSGQNSKDVLIPFGLGGFE